MYEDKIIRELKTILYTNGRAINMKMNEEYLRTHGYSEHVDILLYDVNVLHPELKFTERLRIALFDGVYIPLCRCCSKEISHKWNGSEWATVCSKKCAQNDSTNKSKMLVGQSRVDWDVVVSKRMGTLFERTGYEHQSQNPKHKAKIGVWSREYYSDEDNVALANAKREESNIKSRGVPYLMQLPEVATQRSTKSKETKSKQSKEKKNEIADAYRLTTLGETIFSLVSDFKFLDFEYYIQKKSTYQIARELFISRDAVLYALRRANIQLDTEREVPNTSKSKAETELYTFIKALAPSAIQSKKFKRKELDIYIPELNLGFEFNGVYWHSELCCGDDYHVVKYNHFKNLGIRYIQIWEDDWYNKNSVIKQILTNQLSTQERIGARKTTVQEISQDEFSKFLNLNHIQGETKTKVRLALIYENKIVSVMGFNKIAKNVRGSDNSYALNRFANTNITGAFAKLLNAFEEQCSPSMIRTFADLEIVSELKNVYLSNGFIEVSRLKSDYKYYNNRTKRREHKFKWRKATFAKLGISINGKTEHQLALEYGLARCYDSGKIIYEKVY